MDTLYQELQTAYSIVPGLIDEAEDYTNLVSVTNKYGTSKGLLSYVQGIYPWVNHDTAAVENFLSVDPRTVSVAVEGIGATIIEKIKKFFSWIVNLLKKFKDKFFKLLGDESKSLDIVLNKLDTAPATCNLNRGKYIPVLNDFTVDKIFTYMNRYLEMQHSQLNNFFRKADNAKSAEELANIHPEYNVDTNTNSGKSIARLYIDSDDCWTYFGREAKYGKKDHVVNYLKRLKDSFATKSDTANTLQAAIDSVTQAYQEATAPEVQQDSKTVNLLKEKMRISQEFFDNFFKGYLAQYLKVARAIINIGKAYLICSF